MPDVVMRVRLKREQVRQLLANLPGLLSGRIPDPTGEVRHLHILLGQVALAHIKDAFVTKSAGGTDEAGESWPALAPATVRGRRQGSGEGEPQILRDTGVLLNSLSPGDPGNILDVDPGVITIGTNVPYARYHHEGTATIPARPIWPNPENWPAAWWDDLAAEVRDAVLRIITRLLGAK